MGEQDRGFHAERLQVLPVCQGPRAESTFLAAIDGRDSRDSTARTAAPPRVATRRTPAGGQSRALQDPPRSHAVKGATHRRGSGDPRRGAGPPPSSSVASRPPHLAVTRRAASPFRLLFARSPALRVAALSSRHRWVAPPVLMLRPCTARFSGGCSVHNHARASDARPTVRYNSCRITHAGRVSSGIPGRSSSSRNRAERERWKAGIASVRCRKPQYPWRSGSSDTLGGQPSLIDENTAPAPLMPATEPSQVPALAVGEPESGKPCPRWSVSQMRSAPLDQGRVRLRPPRAECLGRLGERR
jgi:hypothetical protein